MGQVGILKVAVRQVGPGQVGVSQQGAGQIRPGHRPAAHPLAGHVGRKRLRGRQTGKAEGGDAHGRQCDATLYRKYS